MGIYIKGMEMPESCFYGCPLSGTACRLWKLMMAEGTEMRHKDCPLVAVPDHGDLIDANTMIGVELYDECREEWYEEAMTIWEYLGHASTANVQIVIPAERSEDAVN